MSRVLSAVPAGIEIKPDREKYTANICRVYEVMRRRGTFCKKFIPEGFKNSILLFRGISYRSNRVLWTANFNILCEMTMEIGKINLYFYRANIKYNKY